MHTQPNLALRCNSTLQSRGDATPRGFPVNPSPSPIAILQNAGIRQGASVPPPCHNVILGFIKWHGYENLERSLRRLQDDKDDGRTTACNFQFRAHFAQIIEISFAPRVPSATGVCCLLCVY